MKLSSKQANQLSKFIQLAQQILNDAQRNGGKRSSSAAVATRTRRRGKELVAFKKMIKAERKAGASVAELASKHGVTPSYLYQMR